MTMTGRTIPDKTQPEFVQGDERFPWGREFGAIDAAILIPSGSTKQFVKGRRGFGIQRTEGREKRA